MKPVVLLLFFLFIMRVLWAQPYIEGGNTRHRFSQMTFGFEGRVYPDGKKSFMEPRFILGGTHFWGHADFYLSIPMAKIGAQNFGNGVETGAKVYPWRIESGKLRPFAGCAWEFSRFQYGEGSQMMWVRMPVQSGVTYAKGQHLFELGAHYYGKKAPDYFFTENAKWKPDVARWSLSLSYRFMFETTASAEKSYQDGSTFRYEKALAKEKRLNGLTLGIGLSSAFYLQQSAYNGENQPWIGAHKSANIFPEFAVGYYWHAPDIQLNLSYRRIRSTQQAFGLEQRFQRRSLTAESYWFFADYHGFVPFIGPALSLDQFQVKETGRVEYFSSKTTVRPGLTFGWDIRPNRIQSWYLRTNLRWFPGARWTGKEGRQFDFSQIESNFIELVVFPGRIF